MGKFKKKDIKKPSRKKKGESTGKKKAKKPAQVGISSDSKKRQPVKQDKSKRKKSPAQIAHLERIKKFLWKPGQSGNPNGRPKNLMTMTISLRERLNDLACTSPNAKKRAIELGLDPDFCTVADVLNEWAINQTMSRQSPAFYQEVFNRADGRVPLADQDLGDMSPDEYARKVAMATREMDDSIGNPP